MAFVVADLLERNGYQECVTLVRDYSVWMFSQQEYPVRELALDLAAALGRL